MTTPSDKSVPTQVHIQAAADGEARQFIAGRDQTIYIGSPAASAVAMRTLPRDNVAFTGRRAELKHLLAAADQQQAAAVHAVDGMPGVGKTALVIRAAYLLASLYPDGQLFVQLHAHTPGRSPADPTALLADLLSCTGMSLAEIPQGLDARAARWRSRLADKRVLLVLDDAASQAQIEPLLPGAAGCLVLVTSRHRLIALEGGGHLPLETLPPSQAAQLFIRLSRHTPTGAEAHRAVEEIVELCGRLPLALTLLAGRLAHHRTWSFAELAEQFAAADRLTELTAGDRPGDRSVPVAFEMSYRDLPSARQQVYRLLALHPGSEVDAYATAALADIPLSQAHRDLGALYIDHLVEEPTAGRYWLHDLLRTYLRSLVIRHHSTQDQDKALDRLLHYYLRTGLTACYRLGQPGFSPPPATFPLVTPNLSDRASALVWKRTERDNLLACIGYAAFHREWQMSSALTTVLVSHNQAVVIYPEVDGRLPVLVAIDPEEEHGDTVPISADS